MSDNGKWYLLVTKKRVNNVNHEKLLVLSLRIPNGKEEWLYKTAREGSQLYNNKWRLTLNAIR